MFSFSPGQGLVEERRSDAWWKDGQSCQRWKTRKTKKKKQKTKKSIPLCS